MIQKELNIRYFDWMCGLIYNKKIRKRLSYKKLLWSLYNTEFHYVMEMDGNRAADGVDLRDRFSYESSKVIENHPCSVLEMLIALAIRCEEHIMDDPNIGNRTKQWFWLMIENLGLYSMDDKNFDDIYVENIVISFLNREYGRNGEGGLFILKDCAYDLRNVEIWYQMCWYLDNIV